MGGGKKKKQNAWTNFRNWTSKAATGKTWDEQYGDDREMTGKNVNSMTIEEYSSLLTKSGLQGQKGYETATLLKEEAKLNKRNIDIKAKMADSTKVKSLLKAIRDRENQLSISKKNKIGQQTGVRRAL